MRSCEAAIRVSDVGALTFRSHQSPRRLRGLHRDRPHSEQAGKASQVGTRRASARALPSMHPHRFTVTLADVPIIRRPREPRGELEHVQGESRGAIVADAKALITFFLCALCFFCSLFLSFSLSSLPLFSPSLSLSLSQPLFCLSPLLFAFLSLSEAPFHSKTLVSAAIPNVYSVEGSMSTALCCCVHSCSCLILDVERKRGVPSLHDSVHLEGQGPLTRAWRVRGEERRKVRMHGTFYD